MDKTTLVRSDLEIQGLVLEALSQAQIPITLCAWNYVPELDEWQLIIATPLYDSKGPRAAYSIVTKALQAAGIYQDVPVRRLFVKSPNDSIVSSVQQDIADREEVAIHVLGGAGSNHEKRFALFFAPFSGPGGRVPAKHIVGTDALREFLENRLHIKRSSVEEALADLDRKGSASIFNVQLSPREARILGLN